LRNLKLRAPAGVRWHSFTGGTGALLISSRQESGSKVLEVPALLMLPLYRTLAEWIGIFRDLFRCQFVQEVLTIQRGKAKRFLPPRGDKAVGVCMQVSGQVKGGERIR